MEKMPTFFDHVRNSGLVEVKKLKRLVESLRVRKRIIYDSRSDYRSQVSQLKKVAGYDRLPPLEQYVARECLRLDWLNIWQISQLIEGRLRFTLGDYHIIDSLGQGGYAHVFLAKSAKTSEHVAIKVFQESQSQPEVLARFLREAMLQESISHKNIVRLISCEQDGNVDYLVFEYMAGGDVRRLIRNEVQMPILQSARIISQAAEGLTYLHSQKIVHRDVKPANILLTASGVAKLGDLGLCGFLDERAESDPRFGKLVGTADYMAPDHILNPRQSSPQWDIYSLGCTFYQMVTGTVPFPKDNSREKVMAHLRSELVDPQVFREDLPEELSLIIARMMSKTQALRFQTMEDVQESLAPWCDDKNAVAVGLAHEPKHIAVDVKTLQKLRDYSEHANETSEGGDAGETLDLAAVGEVPLEIEIYDLQKPQEERSGDFSFELPVEPIDEELPLRFDQKSLFEFVSTFEEAIRISDIPDRTAEQDHRTQPDKLPQDSDSKTTTAEYIRVRLPGQTESIVIEVPPMMMDDVNTPDDRNKTESKFRRKRPPRPFEPRTLLFWLFVAVFVFIIAMTIVLLEVKFNFPINLFFHGD